MPWIILLEFYECEFLGRNDGTEVQAQSEELYIHYYWGTTPSGTQSTITNLGAGIAPVSVTDAHGCVSSTPHANWNPMSL